MPLGHLFQYFIRKRDCAESVRKSGAISLVSNDFLDGPTFDPLQPAQSKRCFSILTAALEMNQKSINFGTIWDTFFMKFFDFESRGRQIDEKRK